MSRATRVIGRCAGFLLMISLWAPAHAHNDGDDVFHFNVSPNGYPPYLIVDGDRVSGIMWDVMALILPKLGYELNARKIPRKRVDQMLRKGYIDGTPRAREWTADPEKFRFTDAIVYVEEVFFFREDSELEYHRPEDLFGKTVVTPLGYIYPELTTYFQDERIKRFDVSRDRNMFRYLLHSDRFDAALADRLVGKWIMRQEGIGGKLRSSSKSISRYGLRLMLRRDNQAFAEAFNRELENARESGELDRILADYR